MGWAQRMQMELGLAGLGGISSLLRREQAHVDAKVRQARRDESLEGVQRRQRHSDFCGGRLVRDEFKRAQVRQAAHND